MDDAIPRGFLRYLVHPHRLLDLSHVIVQELVIGGMAEDPTVRAVSARTRRR